MSEELERLVERASQREGRVVFLTGAGISAESGIPTFRGAEGFWKVGSRNYKPMELATRAAFQSAPDHAWGWYLYRRAACRRALPNAAHLALAELETKIADRFLLVTQNVDGLHLRAGSTLARTYQIHGNIDFMRCAADCTLSIVPVPEELGADWAKDAVPGEREKTLLQCAHCGGPSRPHVLWFDEYYDEERFRFTSSLSAAANAALLVIVGTSGATNLPSQMCETAARRGIPMIVVDVEPTTFSAIAVRSGGVYLEGTATSVVPTLTKLFERHFAG